MAFMATPTAHKRVVKFPELLQPTRTFIEAAFYVFFFRLRPFPALSPDPFKLTGLKCVLVRVAPTGAEEPTMDLRKLPLGIEVADPEAPLLGLLGRWSSKT